MDSHRCHSAAGREGSGPGSLPQVTWPRGTTRLASEGHWAGRRRVYRGVPPQELGGRWQEGQRAQIPSHQVLPDPVSLGLGRPGRSDWSPESPRGGESRGGQAPLCSCNPWRQSLKGSGTHWPQGTPGPPDYVPGFWSGSVKGLAEGASRPACPGTPPLGCLWDEQLPGWCSVSEANPGQPARAGTPPCLERVRGPCGVSTAEAERAGP